MEKGKRPSAKMVEMWYDENVEIVWADSSKGQPELSDCKAHAAALRSVDATRSYFQRYRAAKKTAVSDAAESKKNAKEKDPEAGPAVQGIQGSRKLTLEKKNVRIWPLARGPPPPGHIQAAAKRKLEEQEALERKVKARAAAEGSNQTEAEILVGGVGEFEPKAFFGALQQMMNDMNEKGGKGDVMNEEGPSDLVNKSTPQGDRGRWEGSIDLAHHQTDYLPSIAASEASTQPVRPAALWGGSGLGRWETSRQSPAPAPAPAPFPAPSCTYLCSPIGGKVEGLETMFASPMPPPPLPLTHHLGLPSQPTFYPGPSLPPSTLKQHPLGQMAPSSSPSPFHVASPSRSMLSHLSILSHSPSHRGLMQGQGQGFQARPPFVSSSSATRGSFPPSLPSVPALTSSGIIPCPPGSCTKKYLGLGSGLGLGLGLGAGLGLGLGASPSPLRFDPQGMDDEMIRMLEGETPTRNHQHATHPHPHPHPHLLSSLGPHRTPLPPLFVPPSAPADAPVAVPLSFISLLGSSP